MFCAAAFSVHSIHSTAPLSWGKGGLLSQYDTKMLPHVHNSFTIAEAVSAMIVQVRLSHCEYPIFGRHGGNLMNNFWKRKVPAFLLTLVMLASLAPAALAVPSSTAGGNCTSTAAVNGQHRWDNGTTISRPTCAREGKQVYACQNTGCITAITEPISKTNVHSYKVVSDTATCGASGERLSRCEICQDEKREVSPATGNHKPNANGECTVCHQIGRAHV